MLSKNHTPLNREKKVPSRNTSFSIFTWLEIIYFISPTKYNCFGLNTLISDSWSFLHHILALACIANHLCYQQTTLNNLHRGLASPEECLYLIYNNQMGITHSQPCLFPKQFIYFHTSSITHISYSNQASSPCFIFVKHSAIQANSPYYMLSSSHKVYNNVAFI